MLKTQYRFTVEWGDCDPADIVFYPNYLKWMDTSTRYLFKAAGLEIMSMFAELDMVGLPIVDAHANFKIASTVGDELVVESWVEEWRGKTFLVRHNILKRGALAVEGHELRIWGIRHPETRALKAGVVPADIVARFG